MAKEKEKPNPYTENFKAVIQEMLTKYAADDPLFAKSFAKTNKTIEECINYILTTVQKSGVQGFTDGEVYSMAIHYYDEDDIKSPKAPQCKVIVNHTIQLSEQELKDQKKAALDQVIAEEKQRLTRKVTPTIKLPEKENKPQQELLF